MTRAFVALGANLGRRQTAMRAALRRLGELPKSRLMKVASFRETEPVDARAGSPKFINSAVEIETELSAQELLGHLHRIERELGRDRSAGEVNAPRSIDLDLLLFGELTVLLPELTLPHPRMWGRRFVLEPLAEIAPDLVEPVSGKSVRVLLDELP